MKNNKKIAYIDLDDTLANFKYAKAFKNSPFVKNDPRMYKRGFFLNLRPIPGALEAVRELIKMGFDVQILTKPLSGSDISYTEKSKWVRKFLPELVNKINMTQDKGLLKGEFLIDDDAKQWKNKFEANGGEFIQVKNHEDVFWSKVQWKKIVHRFYRIDPKRGK